MAHPDDAELCMGGTLARFAHAGYDVHIVVASIPNLREARVEETRRAAAILGAKVHWAFHEGTWRIEDIPVSNLVGIFDEFVRNLAPHLIFTHWDHDTHYDHVTVAKAALASVRRRSVNVYMCESPNLYAPTEIAFDANTFVDITNFMKQRLDSVRIHETQTLDRNYEDQILTRARFYGHRFNCKYAEAFKCVIQELRT